MKTTPWILLAIIAIYASNFSTAYPSIASKPGFVFDKEKLLEDFNNQRRAFAKEKNLARMYKLEWDEDLVKKASENNFTLKDYRSFYDMPKDDLTLRHMEKDYDRYSTRTKQHSKGVSVFYHEVLLSGQKKVGCASSRDYSPGVFDIDGKKTVYNFGMQCLLAPEKDFETYDSPKGEPGSQCDGGLDNDDGLCGILPPTTTDSSNTTYFIIGGCVVVGGILLVVIVVVVFCILKRKKGKDQGVTAAGATIGTGAATGTTKQTTRTGTTNTVTNPTATARY